MGFLPEQGYNLLHVTVGHFINIHFPFTYKS